MKSLDIVNEYIKFAKKYDLYDKEVKEEFGTIKNDLEDYEKLKEKETPYELTYEGDGYDPTTGELVYDTAICKCGREFEEYYEEHYNYCPSCGQKLKWLEEENET